AMVMVDDAHGSGVLGPDGRGTPAAQGVADRVHIHLGTLSKAIGAAGGFVAGRADLVDLLCNRARSFVFDTAPPPAVVGAALEGVRIARAEPHRRAAALRAARRLAAGLGVPEPAACVVPLIVGDPVATLERSATLEQAGFRVVGIRPPTVPEGTARLRFTTNAAHDDELVDRLIAAAG
ncbi:MAG TPA: aminotransferase class I/II-fold pyridoxal phosphate-dependent enzyme, partial [Euzebya sp.]|nr:aminotransferase class I/II-fold pyridoxal phosphate-dependent enzyme [Euzebya sp.]